MKKTYKYILAIIVCSVIIFGFIINIPISSLDEIWNYSFAKNIVDGNLPYKDYNMVTTPLLPFLVSIFLKCIFNGLLMTRILSAILSALIVVMIYIVLGKLFMNKYIKMFITLNILILLIPYFCLDYNWLVLLFYLIILNYELKSKEKKLININYKKDFIFGIIAGLAILSKQSIGLILAVIYVGYKFLAIRSREDLKTVFKISIVRGLGVLIPLSIFGIYLIVTNSFTDFYNFCVLGVSEFTNSLPYEYLFTNTKYKLNIKILAVVIPCVIIIALVYLIKNYKTDTLEKKNILKLFIYGIASVVVAYPICNDIHFIIGIVILIILTIYIIKVYLDFKKIKFEKLFVYLVYILSVIIIIAAGNSYYKYFTNFERYSGLKHFEYMPINSNAVKVINFVNEYIADEEQKGYKIYILDSNAMLYNIPKDKYNKYFDLMLKGNLGKNGSDTVIEKINSLEKNSVILIQNDNCPLNWQMPANIISYIKNNFRKEGYVAIFDIYVKE